MGATQPPATADWIRSALAETWTIRIPSPKIWSKDQEILFLPRIEFLLRTEEKYKFSTSRRLLSTVLTELAERQE